MKSKTSQNSAKFKSHPIQLIKFGVRELFIQSNIPPDVNVTADPDSCDIRTSSSPYDSKTKRIMVSIGLKLGVEKDKSEVPYTMRIELIGIFEVDESRFSPEHVPDWAKKGAPLILFPYLREHAFGLSSRCGFKPLLLPLLEVPTFKIEEKPKRKKAQPK
ncbi:MAG: protein-export chaperone SecB [Desulfomonilaceae bacterium]